MRRTKQTFFAVAAVAALLVGCGDEAAEPPPPPTTDPESGFSLSADQLSVPRTSIVGHPGLERWEVEVAHIREDVGSVTLHLEIPPNPEAEKEAEADAEDEAGDEPAPESAGESTVLGEIPHDQPDLVSQYNAVKDLPRTPIPSPSLSWGSAQVDDTWLFQNPTRSLNPLVFLVVENRGEWLKVQFPARPNHQTAWLNARFVDLEVHKWHGEINATTNMMRVWDGDELKVETSVVAGTPETATPLGRFYFNEKQQVYPTSPYGSWILSTNGFSNDLELFGGEVPIFGLHGTANPEQVGQDISNGCIRMPNPVVEMLAAEMPLGTPFDVVA